MQRQEILRQRMRAGGGARVVIEHGGGAHRIGRWSASGDRYFVELEPGETMPPGLARLRLDLPSGVHHFQAWVHPAPGRRYQVLPHQSVDIEDRRQGIRLLVDLPGALGRAEAALDTPVRVRDLSANGVGFQCAADLPVGDRHFLRVEGEAGTRLGILAGTIVRVVPAEAARRYGFQLERTAEGRERMYACMAQIRRRAALPARPPAEGAAPA